METKDFEKLGVYYLGKTWSESAGATTGDLVLYDSKDLTTHAVCVGMTGSGKTGLCLSLLEEAAIDGVPTIAIDPKGDLGNLLLTFPELAPRDFEPWIEPSEARSRGETVESWAAKTAALWKQGLAEWGQDGARIARFRDSVEIRIYTPGSDAGLPLNLLSSFAAPPEATRNDREAFLDGVQGAVSSLLALVGEPSDPIRSREQILLSRIFEAQWARGEDLDLTAIIRDIQTPPFERVGVLDLESYYPARERFELAMRLNNLLASPDFALWMQGEPIDIERLLWTEEGKPRISILSIAHLAEAERMSFVTRVLDETLAWVRRQPGTSSLRAQLYMDEIFGFFPPTANPPSKRPMLTLLKQARAYGFGCILATQNPVDLDYKGLANAGTWFLGRLQTERDKQRVLDGLEGASAAAGGTFDRAAIERTLSGLAKRVFLMNNVHEDTPVLFQTRWALSYLRGPLTRAQIRTLMDPIKSKTAPTVRSNGEPGLSPSAPRKQARSEPTPAAPVRNPATVESAGRPVLPAEIPEFFLPLSRAPREGEGIEYRPALFATARVHWVDSKLGVDEWQTISLLAPLDDSTMSDPWEASSDVTESAFELEKDGEPGAVFGELPTAATQPKTHKKWARELENWIVRKRPLELRGCAAAGLVSRAGEAEGEFRRRVSLARREKRDLEKSKLEARHAPKLARLRERIRVADERVAREKSQYDQQKLQTSISFGATILGALFGRRLTSAGNVGRAASAARGVGRAAKERGDISRAEEEVKVRTEELANLEAEFRAELDALEDNATSGDSEFEIVSISPRKADIAIRHLALVWTAWLFDGRGRVERAFEG
jgi:DNA helicase HerA-like ATPase